MTKKDYLNIVEKNVRDEAGHFIKSGLVTAKVYNAPNTVFTLDTVKGFGAGDEIYLQDSTNFLITPAIAVDLTLRKITVTGDQTAFALGTQIKKNDAGQYLNNALLVYSKFKPLMEGQQYLVSNSQLMDLPTNWEQGFSSIDEIRYPLSTSQISFIDDRYFKIIIDGNGDYKIFFDYALNGTALITFFKRHSFDDSDYSCTVPDSDRYAVCDIASAYYILSLAARYAQSINASIGAEVVNNEPKPNHYAMLYNMFMNKAAMWLNIDVDELKKGIAQDEAVSSNQEMDPQPTDDDQLIRVNSNNYSSY